MSSTHEQFHRAEPTEIGSNRSFGFVFTVFFLVVGLSPLMHGRPLRLWALAVAAVMLIVSLLVPHLLDLPNRLWAQFGVLLSHIVSPIALGILFFGVVTPIGILMRLFAKDPLRLQYNREADSYWIIRTPSGH
ncbi:MAG TPA: SxtJ family membrane protein, partial [Burkholderiaceae bacterium]|nr:SxtJ family membrane protein [Burkholderiaceae bacterium]